jgi:hypothetical protein
MLPTLNLPGLDVTFVWLVIKWALVAVAVLFVGFAVVMISQVRQMVMTVKRPFNSVIVLISVIYMGLTIMALLMTLGVL